VESRKVTFLFEGKGRVTERNAIRKRAGNTLVLCVKEKVDYPRVDGRKGRNAERGLILIWDAGPSQRKKQDVKPLLAGINNQSGKGREGVKAE